MPVRPAPSLDLLAIGESLRDVFYLLHEATVSCSLHKDQCLLCLEYAEKIPVEQVTKVQAAGNAANAAVGAARLGLRSGLVSWVGTDNAGVDIQATLKQEGVHVGCVMSDKTRPTSEATILMFQGERTQLVYFQPRTYALPRLPKAKAIYYTAMGKPSTKFDAALLKELQANPQTLFTFQPGTTHVRLGLAPLKKLIARSDLFILNKDEAHVILGDGERTMCNLLSAFHHLGAKHVVITDGKNGADASDGSTHWHMPIFPGEAKERTGAGDSFATALTVAMVQGKDLPEALRMGTANSWSVVREIGPQAGLLTTAKMKAVLQKFKTIKPTIHKHT